MERDINDPKHVDNIGFGGAHWGEFVRARQERLGVPMASNMPHSAHLIDRQVKAVEYQEYPKHVLGVTVNNAEEEEAVKAASKTLQVVAEGKKGKKSE
jgi:hypothetical protein